MGGITLKRVLDPAQIIFKPKTPKPPQPPSIPPPPALPPSPTDPAVLAARDQSRRASGNANRQTILTSPLGLTTPAFTTGSKSLLGQ